MKALQRCAPRRTVPTACLLVGWLAAFAGFRALTLPEEARYIGVAWAMLQAGDWLTPTLDAMPFLDKPPLFYWIEAGALGSIGGVQWASRVASLIGATAGALAVGHLVRLRTNERQALWTLLILATLPLFFGGAQFANLDMLAAGCIAVTISIAAESLLRAQAEVPHRRLVAAAWASAAVGVLAKGLIGVVLPALVLLAWSLATGRTRLLRSFVWPPALLAFGAIAIPWFAAEELLHPGFARYFFLHQHFERFAGTGFNSVRPWWFYGAVLPLAALPWSVWLLRAALRRRPGEGDGSHALRTLMWAWLASVAVFFSIPQSKPIGYIMPALFPLSYLLADAVCAGSASTLRLRLAKATLALAAAASLAYVVVSGLSYERDNRMLGTTLGLLYKKGDPVVFAGGYYYDVAIYARLEQPVRVVGEWNDPAFSKQDDWRRELTDASRFAAGRAGSILVDRHAGFARPCGRALWAVTPIGEGSKLAELSAAVRILESNGAALWKFAALKCPEGSGVD